MYLDIIKTGGPIFVVIFVIAAIGLFFFFERFLSLTVLKNSIRNDDESHPFLKRLSSRISGTRTVKIDEISEVIEIESVRLSKNFRIVSTAATVSPLLGLLGTTTGMIKIFNTIQKSENLKYVNELAAGIGEALYTTIAGLIVAIVLTILLSFLKEMLGTIKYELADKALKPVSETKKTRLI